MASFDPSPAMAEVLGYPYIGPWTDGAAASFSVWAPRCNRLAVEWRTSDGGGRLPMAHDADGVFRSGPIDICGGGPVTYWLVDEHEATLPDPVSRFQPEGVWGPSQLVPRAFAWHDEGWRGLPLADYVIYELHVGSFTSAGTFAAAIEKLPYLKDLGVTCVELMPVGQFSGRWNWGYDGVLPYAAQSTYGGPEGFKRFVDACHDEGLAVCLDVVYNHIGPEGSVLHRFAPYFSPTKRTPWGDGLNFEGPHNRYVRGYFLHNAWQWLDEFHVDALRLDAVHSYHDQSERHLLRDLADAVGELASGTGRTVHLIGEGNVHNPHYFRSESKACWHLDANWNDDFVFSELAAFAGETRNQRRNYRPWHDLAGTIEHGAVYTGLPWEAERVLDPQAAAIDWSAQVFYLQNHDQVGNRPLGDRVATRYDPETARMLAALVLLSPSIPLLFMGEEYGERNPFYFFVDFRSPELRRAVEQGRRREFSEQMQTAAPPPPNDPECFFASKLSWAVDDHPDTLSFYRRLIGLRKAWRRHGLLDPACREVELEGEQETINIRYRAHGHQAGLCTSRNPDALPPLPGAIRYQTTDAPALRYLRIADTLGPMP